MFHKLERTQDGSYMITHRRTFAPDDPYHTGKHMHLNKETVKDIFEFAYNMSFGGGGEHRAHRSGGTHERHNGEIFANAFQGKLAEYIVLGFLHTKGCTVTKDDLDLQTYSLGQWDSVDIEKNGVTISVKSTKSFGNLILLETKDWDEDGCYKPNGKSYDYTFLVRLDPFCESIMQNHRLLHSDTVDKDYLYNIICSETWKFDIPGFITNDDLKQIIRKRHIIKRGARLHNTPMDAENFYIQSGDLHSIDEFNI